MSYYSDGYDGRFEAEHDEEVILRNAKRLGVSREQLLAAAWYTHQLIQEDGYAPREFWEACSRVWEEPLPEITKNCPIVLFQ